MAIYTFTPDHAVGDGQATTLSSLLATITPTQQVMLRQITHIVRPPIDAPQVVNVLTGISLAIKAYGEALANPNQSFKELMEGIESLRHDAILRSTTLNILIEPERPLQRRLTNFQAWNLCFTLANAPDNKFIQAAAGVELALSLATGKPFPNGYAADLRRTLETQSPIIWANADQDIRQFSFGKYLEKAQRNASTLFEGAINERNELNESVSQLTIETRTIHNISRNQKYARPNHRRGVLDHEAQSKSHVLQSAVDLRKKAEAGDETSLLAILSFCIGISPELTNLLPLVNHVPSEWVITGDLELGCVMTNLDPIFEDAAKPSVASSSNHLPANKIIVKPLPQFVSSLLTDRLGKSPHARNIGILLPNAGTSGKYPTIDSNSSGIAPSLRRFLNSAAPYAIQIGLDRLIAAAITNDFSVIPGAKPYYAQVTREEIWDASSKFFDSLGWGEPVALQSGLAVGTQVAPTREALSQQYIWMSDQVEKQSPGKNYTLGSLIKHHNAFAKLSASFAIMCLASREVNQLKVTSQGACDDATFTTLYDKRTGQFPGPLHVPVNKIISPQFKLWRAHCAAFDRRLHKLGIAESSKLRIYLRPLVSG